MFLFSFLLNHYNGCGSSCPEILRADFVPNGSGAEQVAIFTIPSYSESKETDATTTGDYKWYVSTDRTTWTLFAENSIGIYQLTGSEILDVKTYYKVERKLTAVDEMAVSNYLAITPMCDHTEADPSETGTLGGMLLINFDSGSTDTIAYSKEIDPTTISGFDSGSSLTFSAWFASAAKQGSIDRIDMVLKIQETNDGCSTWNTLSSVVSTVDYDSDWERGEASVDIVTVAQKYR